MENKRRKLCLLAMIFVIGGIFGFIYEELFYRIDLGYFVKRGTTFGPWIPIYGFGACGMFCLPEKLKKKKVLLVFGAALLAGTLEYLTGFVLFEVFHTRLWDYNVEIWNWGNIGGYVCFRSVALFGMCGLVVCHVVEPILNWFLDHTENRKAQIIAFLPAGLFILDIVVSLLTKALG